jgi:hypothetical protein
MRLRAGGAAVESGQASDCKSAKREQRATRIKGTINNQRASSRGGERSEPVSNPPARGPDRAEGNRTSGFSFLFFNSLFSLTHSMPDFGGTLRGGVPAGSTTVYRSPENTFHALTTNSSCRAVPWSRIANFAISSCVFAHTQPSYRSRVAISATSQSPEYWFT